jgi:hypothetical protein
MDDFYRASRQHFQVLMDGNKPVGGGILTNKIVSHPKENWIHRNLSGLNWTP